jgi:tetratricopeptide (TPR) repeat protein
MAGMVRGRLVAAAGAAAAAMVIWRARRTVRPGGELAAPRTAPPGTLPHDTAAAGTVPPGTAPADDGREEFDRAVALARDAAPTEAVAAYQAIIGQFGDDPARRDLVAAALFNQAILVIRSGRPADALPAIDRAVATYRELEAGRHGPRLRQALELQTEARATALFNEAVAMGRDQRPESPEIAAMVYAEVVRRFGNDPALRHLTAKARFNHAQVLGGLRRDAEAAAAFGELAEAAGEDPHLREMAAKARYSQAVMLRRRCRTSEAQAAIWQAVSLYRELAAADPARYRTGLDQAEEIAAQLDSTAWTNAGSPDAGWAGPVEGGWLQPDEHLPGVGPAEQVDEGLGCIVQAVHDGL